MVKKAYVKPDVYCESFEMSKHVATCSWDMNLSNKNTCAATSDPDYNGSGNSLSGLVVFAEGNNNCEVQLNSKDVEMYCYTNSEDDFTIYNS